VITIYVVLCWSVAALLTAADLVDIRPWRHEPVMAVVALAVVSILLAPILLPLRVVGAVKERIS
jgi:hypothetical protein